MINEEPTIYKGAGIYKTGDNGGGVDPYDNEYLYPTPDGIYTFGGIDYPYKKINNRYWVIKNLMYEVPGATKNPAGNPNYAAYWDVYGDSDLNYIFGCQYNGYCIQTINSNLTDGWRVPNDDDFNDLIQGFDSNDLKSIKCWGLNTNAQKPTNKSFFTAIPSGQRADGAYNSLMAGAYFWSTSEEPGGTGRINNMRLRDENNIIAFGYNTKSRARSIVICKDL